MLAKAKFYLEFITAFGGVAILLYLGFHIAKQHADNAATATQQTAMSNYDTAEANQLNQIAEQQQINAVVATYLKQSNTATSTTETSTVS